MGHKFNPASLHKLDNSERRKRLPPEEILKRFGLLEGDLILGERLVGIDVNLVEHGRHDEQGQEQ